MRTRVCFLAEPGRPGSDRQEDGNHHADLRPVFLEPGEIYLKRHGCLLFHRPERILSEPGENFTIDEPVILDVIILSIIYYYIYFHRN